MPGGINQKSLALKLLKQRMAFKQSIGPMVPVSSFEDFTAAANQMLSIRLIGVFYLRFAAKRIADARGYWKSPRQQESLNVISEMLIKAEQRCKDREENRRQKRLLREVVGWQPGDRGRPPSYAPKPEPKPVPPKSAATVADDIWNAL